MSILINSGFTNPHSVVRSNKNVVFHRIISATTDLNTLNHVLA